METQPKAIVQKFGLQVRRTVAVNFSLKTDFICKDQVFYTLTLHAPALQSYVSCLTVCDKCFIFQKGLSYHG